MEVVNPFILKNKIGMVKFIDELCNVDYSDLISDFTDESNIDGNNNGGINEDVTNYSDFDTQNPAQDLAIVHNICEVYRKDLENLAKSSQSAKRLVTILTILTQHKQYYSNLRRNAIDQSALLF